MAIGVFNGNFRAGDYRRYRQQIEADARNPKEALLRVEANLMQDCIDIEGESFWSWYESDSVPDNGIIQERIDLIKARIANLQSQPSPIDEAQAIELEIDAKLDSASECNDSIISRELDPDWEIHCQEVNDTRATDYPM